MSDRPSFTYPAASPANAHTHQQLANHFATTTAIADEQLAEDRLVAHDFIAFQKSVHVRGHRQLAREKNESTTDVSTRTIRRLYASWSAARGVVGHLAHSASRTAQLTQTFM